MYDKNHYNIVISLQLIKINGKKNSPAPYEVSKWVQRGSNHTSALAVVTIVRHSEQTVYETCLKHPQGFTKKLE